MLDLLDEEELVDFMMFVVVSRRLESVLDAFVVEKRNEFASEGAALFRGIYSRVIAS